MPVELVDMVLLGADLSHSAFSSSPLASPSAGDESGGDASPCASSGPASRGSGNGGGGGGSGRGGGRGGGGGGALLGCSGDGLTPCRRSSQSCEAESESSDTTRGSGGAHGPGSPLRRGLRKVGARAGAFAALHSKPERWRRRWLVLRDDGLLLCYRRAKDNTPLEVVFSTEFDAVGRADSEARRACVELVSARYADEARSLVLDFGGADERDEWVRALRSAKAAEAKSLALKGADGGGSGGGGGDGGGIGSSGAAGRPSGLAQSYVATRVDVLVARQRGWRLGVRLGSEGGQEVVCAVEAGSAAEAAGLRVGDVVLAVNGQASLS
eukprot:3356271-Pleurochrysis_carterae.AAC.1